MNPYPQANTLYGLLAWDEKRMAAGGTGGTLLTTHDGAGPTWAVEHPLPWFLGDWYAAAAIDGKRGLLFGEAGHLLRREEDGRWVPIPSEGEEALFDTVIGAKGVGVAVGTAGILLRTEDWGQLGKSLLREAGNGSTASVKITRVVMGV